MMPNELKIKADFFHMMKVLTPSVRHQVLDALFLFVFSRKETSLTQPAKKIFDIIQEDVCSQTDIFNINTHQQLPIAKIVLPGDNCYARIPFPQLWENLPYETIPLETDKMLTPILAMNKANQDGTYHIQSIEIPTGSWSDISETLFKNQSDCQRQHPMAQLPFMRDITAEVNKKSLSFKKQGNLSFKQVKSDKKRRFKKSFLHVLKHTIKQIHFKKSERS